MDKSLIRPQRRRQVPKQFSWVDQRLAREHYFERCPPDAWALYLFLLTVADAQGRGQTRKRGQIPRILADGEEEPVHAGESANGVPGNEESHGDKEFGRPARSPTSG